MLAANAFSNVREARNVLHLQFPFVLLIKFISEDSEVLLFSAPRLAAKRYVQAGLTVLKTTGFNFLRS